MVVVSYSCSLFHLHLQYWLECGYCKVRSQTSQLTCIHCIFILGTLLSLTNEIFYISFCLVACYYMHLSHGCKLVKSSIFQVYANIKQREDLQMIPLQHVEPLPPDLIRRQPRVLERYHRLVETNKESLVDALLLNLKQQLILPIPIRDRFRFEVWKPISLPKIELVLPL